MLQAIRRRLTYGNVVATLALFVALGGTSYALTRDSIGARELAARSVGASELKTGAVTSRDVRDRGIALRDIAPAARSALRGARGPAGPPGPRGVTYFAIIDSAGNRSGGNATRSVDSDINGRVLYFASSVAACGYSATLARVPGPGPTEDPPTGSSIIVAANGDGGVLVRTWAGTTPRALPFHLIVAC